MGNNLYEETVIYCIICLPELGKCSLKLFSVQSVIEVSVHLSEHLAERYNADATSVSDLVLEVQADLLNSNVLVDAKVSHIYEVFL